MQQDHLYILLHYEWHLTDQLIYQVEQEFSVGKQAIALCSAPAQSLSKV